MNRRHCAALLTCTALALSAGADTIVGANETLWVTNTESLNLGMAPLQLGTGSTLAFSGGAVGIPGLNEYVRTNATGCGVPGTTGYGTWARAATNLFWAGTNITTALTEYIYTARWLIPQAGTYSFYENIDDGAAIAVDGTTLVQDGVWNTGTCKRDVALVAGWHDLEVRVQNGAGGGGIANAALKSGILYSPSNDLISVANQTNAFPFVDPGDGSVLRTARNGCLTQKTLIAGEATFDLTGYDMATPLRMIGGLIPLTNTAYTARLVVNGQGELTFGASGLDINYPPFNSDVVFSNTPSVTGVTFRDQCMLYAWPTSCPWRVASGATLALAGKNLLGDGDVALTNHNLYILGPQSVAENATVHVQGTNLTVNVKPCVFDSLGVWYGAAMTITNDISLEGTGATLNIPVNADFYLQGKITGTGTVYKTGNGRAQIKEASTVVGDIICNQTILIFEASTAGDSNNTVTVNATGAFALYPAGYGTVPTEAWIKTLKGANTTGKLYVPQYQTMTVDRLDGALSLEGGGTASLHIHTLGSNAVVSVIGTLAVTIDTLLPGASITLAGATTSLAVSGTDNVLDSLVLTSGSIPVSGAFTIRQLSGAGTLVKRGTNTLRINFNTATGGVQIDGGKILLAPPTPESLLGNLPALWLDASATNVFRQYKSYTFTNNFVVISNWFDCRPGAPAYAYNNRGEDSYQVYPYVMTSNLNGRSVVSLGSYEETLSADYSGRTEARRIYFSTNLYPQYAIMVFGSQKGGGAAILGGNTAFQRAGSTAADFRTPTTPIFASTGAAYPVWTNGVSVVATNTGLSGGYQILTVNTQGQLVNALGWKLDYTTSGGQNYGELLFYTNSLTAVQRMTVEACLAAKWHLPYAYTTFPSVTIGTNGTLEIGDDATVGALYGSGSVTVSDADSVQLSGLFRGTINLTGGTLTVPNLAPIPGPECVPVTNRSGWFDPCQTNRIVLGGTFTPTRPLTIAALYDCTTTNQYLLGTCNPNVSAATDRRPWLSVTTGPTGASQYWIDYGNPYGDNQGNTLRLNRNPSYIGTETISPIPTNVQSGFIVLDSSRGGGIPIADTVTATGYITRDNPKSVTSPIWGSATTNILRNGATYLDGNAVNGATNGYRGMTEVLSFAATASFKASYFGYYGDSDGTSAGTERLGEILLFDTALADSARADIEAYLMKKWFGRARVGYSDFTAATVAGSGTVSAVAPTRLPAFDAVFSGTVALSATAFDFTVTTNASGATVVAPATVIPGTLSVASTGTIRVHFAVKPRTGLYTLIAHGVITGTGFANWTLVTDGLQPAQTVLLSKTPTALNLHVASRGTFISLL
jgi:hypothetical protein